MANNAAGKSARSRKRRTRSNSELDNRRLQARVRQLQSERNEYKRSLLETVKPLFADQDLAAIERDILQGKTTPLRPDIDELFNARPE